MQLRNASKRLLVAAVTLLLPLHAAAQDDGELIEEPIQEYDPTVLFEDGPDEPDWIPSLRFGLGVNHQGVDSSLDTLPFPDGSFVTDTDGNMYFNGILRGLDGSRSFVGPRDGANPLGGPSLSIGFEIMGPPIESVIGEPRVFVGFEYRDQLEGKTATVRDQTGPPAIPGVDSQPQTRRIRAKGNAEQLNWMLAGLGTAFQLPIEGYNVKLKPSVNYFYSRTEVEALLIQPIRVASGEFNNFFPQTTLEEVTNHGIAPRLELDAEIYRDGPLAFGFFIAVDFLYIVGGPVKHIVDTNGCFGDGASATPCSRVDDPNDPLYRTSGTLRYELERDRLSYQGIAGIRVSWMGGY